MAWKLLAINRHLSLDQPSLENEHLSFSHSQPADSSLLAVREGEGRRGNHLDASGRPLTASKWTPLNIQALEGKHVILRGEKTWILNTFHCLRMDGDSRLTLVYPWPSCYQPSLLQGKESGILGIPGHHPRFHGHIHLSSQKKAHERDAFCWEVEIEMKVGRLARYYRPCLLHFGVVAGRQE